MEEVSMHSQISLTGKSGNGVLDVKSLAQLSDKCSSGSPGLTRVLSRKGSCQIERCSGEEQDCDEASKSLVIKVIPSQQEPLKTPLAAFPFVANNSMPVDSVDGRNKKSNRLITINPRKILLLFATMSSMGTMILIYFTLALNWRVGS